MRRIDGYDFAESPKPAGLTLFVGKIWERRGKTRERSLPILEDLKSAHDRRKDPCLKEYSQETIFPLAFRALDFAVFWCHNAIQSERGPCSGDRCFCSWSETGGGGGKPFSFPASQLPKYPDELAVKIAEIVEERRLGGRNAKAELEVIRPMSLLQPGEKTPVTRGNSEGWHEASGSGWTDSR
jgi:hypothetical protein